MQHYRQMIRIALAFVALAAVSPAHAAYPGANGKIAFARAHTFVMEPDGSGVTDLVSPNIPGQFDRQPAWSPDGSRIALSRTLDHGANFDIYVMNADGTGATRVTSSPTLDSHPSWSPGRQEAGAHEGRGRQRLPPH